MFELFGISHITAALCISLFVWFVWKVLPRYKHPVRYLIISGLIATEVLFYTLQILSGASEIKDYLPLHISQVAQLLMIVGLSIRSVQLSTLLYFWAIWSSLLAVVLPENAFPFPHPRYIEYFAGYLFLLGGMAWIIRFDKIELTYKAMWQMFGYLVLYAGGVWVVNLVIDANFLFLMQHPSQGQMWFLPTPPWHLPFLGLGVILVFHMVYWAGRLVKRPQTHAGSKKR